MKSGHGATALVAVLEVSCGPTGNYNNGRIRFAFFKQKSGFRRGGLGRPHGRNFMGGGGAPKKMFVTYIRAFCSLSNVRAVFVCACFLFLFVFVSFLFFIFLIVSEDRV